MDVKVILHQTPFIVQFVILLLHMWSKKQANAFTQGYTQA